MNNNVDTDIIIDEAVKQVFEQMHIESLPIKQSYYNEIQKILFEISNFFQIRQNTIQKKRSNKLTNPYAPEYGFSEEALSYAITVEKKETAIIYHKLNRILSLLRNEQELNYVLYIRKKLENGSYSTIRYEVPESEINDFLTIVQGNKFREDENLRQYANVAIERLEKRTEFHKLIYKLVYICDYYKLRLIIENPATPPNYLITGQNFPTPTIIDNNRMERGDYFKKPTAYWFFNCEPTHGFTYQNDKKQKIICECKGSKVAGVCSEERSMISSDYARNFICDFILGKYQADIMGQTLFDFDDL